jgi:hypothetical protein
MKFLGAMVLAMFFICSCGVAEETFAVTGTPVPLNLLHENYGRVPKGIGAFDLNICNITQSRQSVMSSAIFQALAQSNAGLQPIGRQIMLAAILRSQNRSVFNILNVGLASATGTMSVLSSSKYGVPTGVLTGAALGSIVLQQILTNVKPMLSVDQLEKFDSQVLEPALILDAGSCVERTVFTLQMRTAAKLDHLSFHVR